MSHLLVKAYCAYVTLWAATADFAVALNRLVETTA